MVRARLHPLASVLELGGGLEVVLIARPRLTSRCPYVAVCSGRAEVLDRAGAVGDVVVVGVLAVGGVVDEAKRSSPVGLRIAFLVLCVARDDAFLVSVPSSLTSRIALSALAASRLVLRSIATCSPRSSASPSLSTVGTPRAVAMPKSGTGEKLRTPRAARAVMLRVGRGLGV